MENISVKQGQGSNPKSAITEFGCNKQSPFFKNSIQPKLTINNHNDIYEQEADSVAEQVMRMPITQHDNYFFKPANISSIQRKCEHCEEEEKLQRKENRWGEIEASNDLENYVGNINSGGTQLPNNVRSFFEPKFGYDFSNVRIHYDSVAAKSADSINALAYTSGNNIVFNQNQYSPNSDGGKKLLAHELTHVVQQGGMLKNLQRQKASTNRLKLHGDLSQVPHDLACNVSIDDVIDEKPIDFYWSSSELSTQMIEILEEFKTRWNNMGKSEDVELHGYASTEGAEDLNWRLSCSRALVVQNYLTAGFNAIPARFISVVAQGETNKFSRSSLSPNRIVSIVSAIPIIPVSPSIPTSLIRKFRASAWSFLSCAECNPFTDDGTFGISPPSMEPSLTSTHRQMHSIEAELGTLDGIHITPGTARLVASPYHVHHSGYCGTNNRAHVVNYVPPSGLIKIVNARGIEGIQFESELNSRVGAVVPPTLPGMPCGYLGTHFLVPFIGNRFRVMLFADGSKDSQFVSATLYPSHFIYEDNLLKMNGGAPVHPAIDFYTWSRSSTPALPGRVASSAGNMFMRALRFRCCHPFLFESCPTICTGGISAPTGMSTMDIAGCAVIGGKLASSCPDPCAPVGSNCSPLVQPSNP